MTSGAKSDGRFGKQDFAYLPEEDASRCPAGERLFGRTSSGHRSQRLATALPSRLPFFGIVFGLGELGDVERGVVERDQLLTLGQFNWIVKWLAGPTPASSRLSSAAFGCAARTRHGSRRSKQ
jgi:hypothetical protein